MLQYDVDISVIALWLEHEKIETAHQYMVANLQMKQETLARLPKIESQNKPYKIKKIF
jgi:hypothetical protein